MIKVKPVPVAYAYVTDVTTRYEDELLTEGQCYTRWHEQLIKCIPLYAEDGNE